MHRQRADERAESGCKDGGCAHGRRLAYGRRAGEKTGVRTDGERVLRRKASAHPRSFTDGRRSHGQRALSEGRRASSRAEGKCTGRGQVQGQRASARAEGRFMGGGQVRTEGACAHRRREGPRTVGRCTDGNRVGVRTARARGGTCARISRRPQPIHERDACIALRAHN
jgi:hypothetical protein